MPGTPEDASNNYITGWLEGAEAEGRPLLAQLRGVEQGMIDAIESDLALAMQRATDLAGSDLVPLARRTRALGYVHGRQATRESLTKAIKNRQWNDLPGLPPSRASRSQAVPVTQ